ncbi:MAG TPA: PEGA domain-containing protein [Thermomicrobiales bacterium]|nr:PEGA domain-containing protein [Thermomicrobiales bacterium]
MLDFLNIKKRIAMSGSSSRPAATQEDSLDAFGSEHGGTLHRGETGREGPSTRRTLLLVVTVVTLVALGAAGYFFRNWRPFNVEAASASLTIESLPAGAEVLSEGVWKGRTPLKLAVQPGEHTFELMYEGRRKPLRAVALAGAVVVHHVEFDAPPSPLEVKTSSLRITTQPARLRVVVDGVSRGVSPLTLEDIAPGTHRVQVIGAANTIERTVDIVAGEAAAVIITAPAAPEGPAAGWLTVNSPVPLQIREGNDIVGTSAASKIMLPAGRHDLVLVNEAIGFSEKRTVQVSPRANASLKVDLPDAPLSINALPWAEVWLDGKRIGETPIGNLQVRLGAHEIVFRHPEFGERKQTVTVTLNAPARVSVDMRKSGS